ncbi:hypothetical protein GCM10007860_00730 [Chitiniphilus shinanonensis]|uniref:YgjP-like metallopeptidase domain-containing protein n=1 Tax=Chitiniphilus shinanonensis TaxID=553088 RepID=A0ABQ6BP39_9NEIS|nr:YgjP-like metallopeptidase domain-containing protein [Chitiniphilus shinanonensis]GLS02930.1 hypothetical protein GCM10007860_00730 [Chitiniphilus shinanonensis]
MSLPYLAGYPPHLLDQIQTLLQRGELGDWVRRRHPGPHEVQTDRALYDYVMARKQRFLKNAPAPAKVLYDNQLDLIGGTLGSNTYASRVQGNRLKRKNEIRIASLLREASEPLLEMLVVHELAHLKVKDHDKAFYQLCCHMLPDYHQLEFELRVWLTWRELG